MRRIDRITWECPACRHHVEVGAGDVPTPYLDYIDGALRQHVVCVGDDVVHRCAHEAARR